MGTTEGVEPLIKQLWHTIARGFSTTVLCLLYRVRIYNKKNIRRRGPLLILSTHQSYFDPMFVQSWVLRNFYFVARESLFKTRIIGPILSSLLIIPIKQGAGDISAMRRIIAKLKGGGAVCLFPEGTRTFDGKVQDVKPGFGLISRRGDADVLPAVVDGAYEAWPRTRKSPGLGKVAVMFGEVIPREEIDRLGDREFARVLTEKLREMHNELRVKMGKEPLDYSTPPSEEADHARASAENEAGVPTARLDRAE
ncbi:MAG: 1-acyl-sn-glycerol-3-phosphate acyltransferase [Phycisphaerae bacterium]|nr:1-acyl-sn-glycerol-3-phosphate acyltransferase [Phycisphaerae bacterium]